MMDEGHTVDVIYYLDFAKAFDSANHRFRLARTKPFGLSGFVVRWIEAYLSREHTSVENSPDRENDGYTHFKLAPRSGIKRLQSYSTRVIRHINNHRVSSLQSIFEIGHFPQPMLN